MSESQPKIPFTTLSDRDLHMFLDLLKEKKETEIKEFKEKLGKRYGYDPAKVKIDANGRVFYTPPPKKEKKTDEPTV